MIIANMRKGQWDPCHTASPRLLVSNPDHCVNDITDHHIVIHLSKLLAGRFHP